MDVFLNMSLDNGTTLAAPEEGQQSGSSGGNYDGEIGEIRSVVVAIEGTVFLITAVFGTITNFISLIIFYRQGIFNDSCTPSLAALALTDFLATLNFLPPAIMNYRENIGLIQWETDKYLIAHIQAIAWVFGTPVRMWVEMSTWTTVYLCLDRMVSVAFPFKVKSIFTPKRSCVIIVCIWIWSFILYLPNLLSTKWIWKDFVNGSVTIIRAVSTGIISTDFYELVSLIKDGPLRLIRVVAVVVFNAIIISKVGQSKKFKQAKAAAATGGINHSSNIPKLSNQKGDNDTKNKKEKDKPDKSLTQQEQQQQKETKLMRMIVVLSSIYALCYFPTLVKEVLYYIDTYVVEFGFYFVPYWAMDRFTDFFEFLNTSTNIVIYYTMSSRYRDELRKLFTCRI